ncbi:uncharacterized protein [Eurosta solidaginis]|uniref:uncharacterized protein n=1 Tax=Eurosta solidaginis TaxID=178769 RepID=UPI003530CF95
MSCTPEDINECANSEHGGLDISPVQEHAPIGHNDVVYPSDPQADIHSHIPYSHFHRNTVAHREFQTKFLDNPFGYVCSVCDRLWFKLDLKPPRAEHEQLLSEII